MTGSVKDVPSKESTDVAAGDASPAGEETVAGDGSETIELPGISLPPTERVIDLFGTVNEQMQNRVRRAVGKLERESDDAIIVRINTNGGRVDAAYAIHDLLATSAVPVITAVYGNAYSAGSIILQAGGTRCLTPYSAVMIHLGTWYLQAGLNVDDAERMRRALQFEEDRADQIIAARSGHSIEEIRAWNREEKYMTAIEAVQMNFADAIIVPRNCEEEPVDRSRVSRMKRAITSVLSGINGIGTIADFIDNFFGNSDDEEDEGDEGEDGRRLIQPNSGLIRKIEFGRQGFPVHPPKGPSRPRR
jgi:ATP-dependent protease ClpP protease subunit